MSTRKRIRSVTVDQILCEIKQMTNYDDSIYKKLSSYDQVLKKYRIDSLNDMALQIYEYLIEQQTVATLPEKSRLKYNSLKFSRSQIQIYEDQSIKNNQNIIEDPQIHNQKLFSFAKNNKNDKKKFINEDQLQPKQLFMQPSKFKSDKKTTKNYPSRLQRDQQKDFVDNLNQNRSLKKSKSKSAKDLTQIQNEGEKSITSKSVIFNSQKSKSIEKVQEMTELKTLQQFLKKNYLMEFLQMIKVSRQQDHFLAIQKKAKYLYCMKLFTKVFETLKINCLIEKQNNKKAQDLNSIRNQSLLEETFIQWQILTKLNEEQKQRIQQIQNNFNHLASFLFINRLKLTSQIIRREKQQKEKLKSQLSKKTEILLKKILYQKFAYKFLGEKDIKQKLNCLIKYKTQNCQKTLMHHIKQFYSLQKRKQSTKINVCRTKIYGKRLLKNLINEQNFMEVYWKRKDQPSKLILLNFLLITLKLNFQRLGYQYTWMKTLQQNINNTDIKTGNTLFLYNKSRVFKWLYKYCMEQKQKRHKVKIILMDSFLKKLVYSNYLNFKKQSEQNKTHQLSQFLFIRKGQEILSRLKKEQEKQFLQKQEILKNYLFTSKSQQFFMYLESYQKTKTYYTNLLSQFEQKRRFYFFSRVWDGFKRILKQQIINNKLIIEYLKLKSKITMQKCFDGLKSNIFEEKLFRKKQQNLNKLVKRKMFSQFFKKLQQNAKYEPIKKKQIEFQFNQNLEKQRKLLFFHQWKKSIKQKLLAQTIQDRLCQNYENHLVTKCFKIMKFITVKTKFQRENFDEIMANNQMKRKFFFFEKLFQVKLKRQSFRSFMSVIEKIQQQKFFESLEEAFMLICEKSIIKERK